MGDARQDGGRGLHQQQLFIVNRFLLSDK